MCDFLEMPLKGSKLAMDFCRGTSHLLSIKYPYALTPRCLLGGQWQCHFEGITFSLHLTWDQGLIYRISYISQFSKACILSFGNYLQERKSIVKVKVSIGVKKCDGQKQLGEEMFNFILQYTSMYIRIIE